MIDFLYQITVDITADVISAGIILWLMWKRLFPPEPDPQTLDQNAPNSQTAPGVPPPP